MQNKLLLIDTFYFMHRSFHAYPIDLQTKKGERINIVFGLAQSLLDSISALNPTHIACGWESEEQPSFRKELYPLYQANRIPGDIEEEKIFFGQFPRIIELLEAFNIPRLVQEGFEGDDVLGTVASLASKELPVVISTSDQDLLQLINKNINVYRPSRPPYISSQLFDEKEFEKKYGFTPKQMIDYKSLRGDSSDNIPGVKGVGDKTAKKLIQEFQNLENIYKNLNKIESASLREKLSSEKENAFLSKQLATIVTNIPMQFNLQSSEVHDFDINQVRALFDELEFNSLQKKLDKLETIQKIKNNLVKKREQVSKKTENNSENQLQFF